MSVFVTHLPWKSHHSPRPLPHVSSILTIQHVESVSQDVSFKQKYLSSFPGVQLFDPSTPSSLTPRWSLLRSFPVRWLRVHFLMALYVCTAALFTVALHYLLMDGFPSRPGSWKLRNISLTSPVRGILYACSNSLSFLYPLLLGT